MRLGFGGWVVGRKLVVLAVVAVLAVSAVVASASTASPQRFGLAAAAARSEQLRLSQAPTGLQAAVRRALGVSRSPLGGASLQAKLTGSPNASGSFGISVAIDGSTAVVGTVSPNSSTGAAYVFVRSGCAWSQQAKLAAPVGAPGGLINVSVAINGSTVVVGATDFFSGTGAVYVFVRSGTAWSQQAKLAASDGAPGTQFGISVAIDGSIVLAGASSNSGSTGAAYVFVRSGTAWSQQAKLTASSDGPGQYFGAAVAVDGSTVVVGAPINGGAVYVFVRSGTAWSQQAEMTDPGGSWPNDFFGGSVALDGSTMVIGSPGGNPGGAAYVFVRSGTSWSQQATLAASDGPPSAFGDSVAISGSTVVVGAVPLVDWDSGTGAAYVFVRSGTAWSQQAKLTGPGGGAPGDGFGNSVAIEGSTAVVGAPGHNSAYVFALRS